MTDFGNLDARRKMLRLRSWRRGMKEMDLIMGTFADRHIAELSGRELEDFAMLSDQPDQKLYSWISGAEAVPAEFDTPVFARLKNTRP
jgi:antitoxin CptB